MTDDIKVIIIAIVCITGSALISGTIVYSRFHIDSPSSLTKTQISPIPKDPIIASPTKSLSVAPSRLSPTSTSPETGDLEEAMKALTDFNEYLSNGQYDKAAELFKWDNIEDPETFFGSGYVAGNNIQTLTNICKNPVYCLKFYKILKTKKTADGNYFFTIQYKTKDGQIFVNSAQVAGSFINNSDFLYTVSKINGKFKVTSPPNWFNTEAK